MNYFFLLVISSACVITCGHMDYHGLEVTEIDKKKVPADSDYRRVWDFASAGQSSHIIEIAVQQPKNNTSSTTQK